MALWQIGYLLFHLFDCKVPIFLFYLILFHFIYFYISPVLKKSRKKDTFNFLCMLFSLWNVIRTQECSLRCLPLLKFLPVDRQQIDKYIYRMIKLRYRPSLALNFLDENCSVLFFELTISAVLLRDHLRLKAPFIVISITFYSPCFPHVEGKKQTNMNADLF